jgi:hypothetical protein
MLSDIGSGAKGTAWRPSIKTGTASNTLFNALYSMTKILNF